MARSTPIPARRNKSVDLSRSVTPSAADQAAPGRKRASKSKRRRRRQHDPAPLPEGAEDFDDMTGDSSHDEDPFSTSSEAGPSRLHAVASTPIDIKGKGRFNGLESGDEAGSAVKSQSLYTPSSFTPLRRSVIFSMEVPSNVGSEDEGGKGGTELPPQRLLPTAPRAASPEKEEGQIEEGEEEGNQSVLLLPDHVVFDDGDDEDEDGDESRRELEEDIEGVVVLDDDKGKGVPRYFMEEEDEFVANADQSRLCRRCKKPGHHEYDCPHIVCTTCGAMDEHERKDCPYSMVCFICGKQGHRRSDCTDPKAKDSSSRNCPDCGGWDHAQSNCPLLWRRYVYRRTSERDEVLEERAAATGWEREALGGPGGDRWCYNCAEEGHFGDDCPRPRASLGRVVRNSAFSERTASRGPYGKLYPNPQSSWRPKASGNSGNHTRWSDSPLPYAAAGFKSGAGQSWREREKQLQRDRERQREGDRYGERDRGSRDHRDRRRDDSDRDDYDWFERDRSFRGRGEPERRSGNNSRNRSRSPPSWRSQRGWDSERRHRDRSPDDRHSRLSQSYRGGPSTPQSAPTSRTAHGQMSSGMPPALAARISSPSLADSPSAQRGSGSQQQSGRAKSLREQVLAPDSHHKPGKPGSGGGYSSAGSGSDSPGPGGGTPLSRRRKGNNNKHEGGASERDWETEWRASGAGGGNVSSWGKDLDRELRDERPRAGPVRGGGGGGGGAGASRSAPAKGQRYTGGY
ncbi:Protein air1 [Vanrija pseudolonga]|uniref:Protein air1 n=1 Tax=Vanrija pseudolonga TaxID=143232 RepID=A0AAF0Y3S9_9TREE|nr:Protein air1 [Vanrija pseudolonga]